MKTMIDEAEKSYLWDFIASPGHRIARLLAKHGEPVYGTEEAPVIGTMLTFAFLLAGLHASSLGGQITCWIIFSLEFMWTVCGFELPMLVQLWALHWCYRRNLVVDVPSELTTAIRNRLSDTLLAYDGSLDEHLPYHINDVITVRAVTRQLKSKFTTDEERKRAQVVIDHAADVIASRLMAIHQLKQTTAEGIHRASFENLTIVAEAVTGANTKRVNLVKPT